MVASRRYDLLVLGATGFTGKLACAYLAARGPAELRWAAVGRSESKLAALSSELGLSNTEVCDVTDTSRLEELIKDSAVVANFAGTPFIDKALPVVELCATHGTGYVDITGETPLQRATYDRYHEKACASKALIVHQCGFDSVPSDLGALLAVNALQEHFGCKAAQLKTFAGESEGGFSGGTLATILYLMTANQKDIPGAAEAEARGCYALDPAGATGGPDKDNNDGRILGYDKVMKTWHVPFIMAESNAPVVRKSAALLNYGVGCSYAEVMASTSLVTAVATLVAYALGGLALFISPVRSLLFSLGWLPKPGEGPSKELQEKGHFHMYTYAVGQDRPEARVVANVRSGDAGDPGYKATARMAIESALCIALQRDACAAGGVLTPASALGLTLVERLRKSGMILDTEVLA